MKTSNVFLYPWTTFSKGGRQITGGLGIRRILPPETSKFQGDATKAVINWGNSKLSDEIKKCRIVNTPTAVGRCTNKLEFFQMIDGTARIPEFTSNVSVAEGWEAEDQMTVGRTQLSSYSGADIVFLRDDLQAWYSAKLFTKYVKKKHEFRVHFGFGAMFDVQKKVLPSNIDKTTVDFRVRNHRNGFIFQRNDIETPADVIEQATLAFKKSNLHFGAVDVIWNETQGKAYVLEINTAPGIEGTTAENYIKMFKTGLEMTGL